MDDKISIGADHGGYEMMQILKEWIQEKWVITKDFGTHSNESVDYPVFAWLLLQINIRESGQPFVGIKTLQP
jgi:ribose 5-phosphate isomerase RpiB